MSLVGPVEQEVLEPGQQTLAELAATVNREHALALEAGASMVEHAIKSGEALLLAREACPSGEWSNWIADHLGVSAFSANFYMRLARYKDVLKGAPDPPESLEMARQMLVGLPDANRSGVSPPPATRVEQARRLREDGLAFEAIGEMMGVSRSTIRCWLDPNVAERQAERARRARAAKNASAARERERAVKRAVGKKGAAAQKLYAICERLQDDIAQAHSEATDPEARRHYALMGEHYRKMRDEGVRALGIS